MPEKFQVKKEDGTLDHEASARKVEEHRSNLEKRLGSGDAPPKTAAEYKLPEKFPEGLPVEGFREKARKAGMSQAAFELVMSEYGQLAPALAEAGNKLDAEACVEQLKKDGWSDPKDYEANTTLALKAAKSLVQGEEEFAQMEQQLGNNPLFIKMMSRIGAQMGEDKTPSAANGGMATGDTKESLMMSDAYRNPSHPQHKAVSERVSKMFGVGGPNDAPLFG